MRLDPLHEHLGGHVAVGAVARDVEDGEPAVHPVLDQLDLTRLEVEQRAKRVERLADAPLDRGAPAALATESGHAGEIRGWRGQSKASPGARVPPRVRRP